MLPILALVALAQRGEPAVLADFASLVGRLGRGERGSTEVDARLDRMFANDPKGRARATEIFSRFARNGAARRRVTLRTGAASGDAGQRALKVYSFAGGAVGPVRAPGPGGLNLKPRGIRLSGFAVDAHEVAQYSPMLVALAVTFPANGDPEIRALRTPKALTLGDLRDGEAVPVGTPVLAETHDDTLVVTAALGNLAVLVKQYKDTYSMRLSGADVDAAASAFEADLTVVAKATAGLVATLDTKNRPLTMQKALEANLDLLRFQAPKGTKYGETDILGASIGYLPLTAETLGGEGAEKRVDGVPYDADLPLASDDGSFKGRALVAYRDATGLDAADKTRGLTLSVYGVYPDGWSGTLFVPEATIDGKVWTSAQGYLDPSQKTPPPGDSPLGGLSWPQPFDTGKLMGELLGSVWGGSNGGPASSGTGATDEGVKATSYDLTHVMRRSQGVGTNLVKILLRVRNCDAKGSPIFDCSVDPAVGKTLTLLYNPKTGRLEGPVKAKRGEIVEIVGKGGNAVRLFVSVSPIE